MRRHFRVALGLLAVFVATLVPPQLIGKAQDFGSTAEHGTVYYDDFHSPSNFTTFPIPPWNHTNITYFFQNGTDDIAGNDEQQSVRNAMALWAAVTPLTFTEVFTPTTADIVLLWAVGAHSSDSFDTPFDGPFGVLAHAFGPGPGIGGDLHFDDSETWTTGTRSDSNQPMDLETVAAHELGHSLGLDHTSVPGALMEPVYVSSHRFLAQDDIAGIQSLYGARGGTPPPPPPSTFSVSLGASSTSVRRRTPVTLTATSNLDPGETAFFITILDAFGRVFQACKTGTTCSVSLVSNRRATGTFLARISAADGTNSQAESAPVTVTWRRR